VRAADLPADLAPVWRGVEQVRASELADGLWCLRLPVPYTAMPSVNAYLLDGHTLVDCGTSLEPGWEALEHGLSLAGASPGDIRRLVVTHTHADHAGLAAEFVERVGCEFLHGVGPHTVDDVLRDPITPLDERRARAMGEGVPADEVDLWVDAHLADDVHHARLAPTRWLAPGSRLGGWTVVPAGGHCANQIALVRDGYAITADLAYDITESFIEYGWTFDPYGEQLASLDRLAALGPRVLLPGHGRPVEDAAARLAAARAAAVELAEWFVAGCASPRSVYELVVERVTDEAEYNRRQTLLAIGLAVLEHMAARGVVRVLEGDVRRFVAV
jgi:glyoxylase-like metal-dependent hydrolase (beta-lactamase superfamily II)